MIIPGVDEDMEKRSHTLLPGNKLFLAGRKVARGHLQSLLKTLRVLLGEKKTLYLKIQFLDIQPKENSHVLASVPGYSGMFIKEKQQK